MSFNTSRFGRKPGEFVDLTGTGPVDEEMAVPVVSRRETVDLTGTGELPHLQVPARSKRDDTDLTWAELNDREFDELTKLGSARMGPTALHQQEWLLAPGLAIHVPDYAGGYAADPPIMAANELQRGFAEVEIAKDELRREVINPLKDWIEEFKRKPDREKIGGSKAHMEDIEDAIEDLEEELKRKNNDLIKWAGANALRSTSRLHDGRLIDPEKLTDMKIEKLIREIRRLIKRVERELKGWRDGMEPYLDDWNLPPPPKPRKKIMLWQEVIEKLCYGLIDARLLLIKLRDLYELSGKFPQELIDDIVGMRNEKRKLRDEATQALQDLQSFRHWVMLPPYLDQDRESYEKFKALKKKSEEIAELIEANKVELRAILDRARNHR